MKAVDQALGSVVSDNRKMSFSMQRVFLLVWALLAAPALFSQNNFAPTDTLIPFRWDPDKAAMVEGTRSGQNDPVTSVNLSGDSIAPLNAGQDFPFLLRFTPSLVVTSDAGAGVGYTGLWIRGSDPSRINVTINGIPLNDPESHAVYWVNIPDFASSVDDLQIQRGAGSSTHGAGAFGGTIKLGTNRFQAEPYGQLNNTFGSFNTRKHTVALGTGLINDRWNFEGRLSQIASDGYVDRATSDLKSYFLSGGWFGEKSSLKALVFGGKEITYQAWNGTPESRINGDTEAMLVHASNEGYSDAQLQNLLDSDRRYNFYLYENEVDNYAQDHYQLHFSHRLVDRWALNISGHYTYGRGYFEQFRERQKFEDYGLENPIIGNDTLKRTDLVRRRWLDNDFYGTTWSLHYQGSRMELTWGGAANRYDGRHFGELVWMEFAPETLPGARYYENEGTKTDINSFVKVNYFLSPKWMLYADMQVRNVDYQTAGIDNNRVAFDVKDNLTFFNPKGGITWLPDDKTKVFISHSVANREPVRSDYVDAPAGKFPLPEMLNDTEAGIERTEKKHRAGLNFYHMHYTNQLVLTGALSDTGSPLRTNAAASYRAGVEAEWAWNFFKNFTWVGNLTLSQNRIEAFTETIYDYSVDFEVIEINHSDTDISFSPSVIASNQVIWQALKKEKVGIELAAMSKYVGKQFLDNTSNDGRSLDAYLTHDARLTLDFRFKGLKSAQLNLLVNNLTNALYSSNGYTYSYIFGNPITENFYYPQAGTNFLLALNLQF